jgi:RNA polymerase sigma factor (sigma-70 family)
MAEHPPDEEPTPGRLEDIATEWGLLWQAHQAGEGAGAARNALVLRYAGAIRGYVGALVRDPQEADELTQELIVRLLRGAFAAASPERGRFRAMLAVAARNLARTHWQRKRRQASLELDAEALADENTPAPGEDEALASWRRSILDMAWRGLEEFERAHPGNVAWTVLRLRAEHPDDDSAALAARLSEQTGRPFRAAAMRQQLRRARKRFAAVLLEEIARTLDDPTPQRVVEELATVGLMEYVQDFLPEGWPGRPANG